MRPIETVGCSFFAGGRFLLSGCGMIVTLGSPAELTATRKDAEIRYRAPDGAPVVLHTKEPARTVAELYATQGELAGLEVRRATLEEIYLSLTEVPE